MYESLLHDLQHRPDAWERTEHAFWDDEHISGSMLANHLNPEQDGASRTHAFIDRSADWIVSQTGPCELLDLGCGPGLYAQRLHDHGCRVTGVDLSHRSITYASQQAAHTGRAINYRCMNYLTLSEQAQWDAAILIYCDYGALPPDDRAELLRRTRDALRPGGVLVLDVFTPAQFTAFDDALTATQEEAGFWRAAPHLTLKRTLRYPDYLFLERYTVIDAAGCTSYNLWNQAFVFDRLIDELQAAGFEQIDLFSDAAGAPYALDSATLCATARR